MMTTKKIGSLTLIYRPEDEDTAAIVDDTCSKAIQLVNDRWGLPAPEDCRIYVMTSWREFVFQSAPWPWRLLLALTFPLWVGRVQRTWPYTGGWAQRYGRRVAIGVKTLSLLEQSDRSIGARIFVVTKDMEEKVRHITCHELVHACSAHLKLPFWLNEGLAMLSVDYFLNQPTVKPETLEMLRGYKPKAPPPTYREVSRMGGEAIAYHTVRGYWLVRFLEETHPSFICRLFTQRLNANKIDHEVDTLFEMDPGSFWSNIDQLLFDHFKGQVN